MSALTTLTAHELLNGYNAGEFTVTEVTRAYLDRIALHDPAVHAYLHVCEERAMADAAEADAKYARGESAPLLGVPLALKDVVGTKGIPTTAASRVLEDYRPPYDATIATKLREAGTVLLGKTNTDEFTMGASTENSAYGPTKNPWDLSCVPGGSSGGSAAALAADLCAVAIGTDTGGSIRQPASLTGIVGMKVTYGRVSRFGVFSMASSLDTIGPMTKDVEDAARVLQVIAGRDDFDTTTTPNPVPDYLEGLKTDLAGMRVGVPTEIRDIPNADMAAAFAASLRTLKSLGATIVDVSLPHADQGIAVYYLVNTAEVSANMSRYDGIRFGPTKDADDLVDLYFESRGAFFGAEVKRRIMLGTFALSHGYKDAFYSKAQKVRALIQHDFVDAFAACDIIAVPTSPVPAFKLGERTADPIDMYLADIYTVPSSLAGIPGISIPCGFSGGLPLGLQLLGPMYEEGRVLAAAYAFEKATEWHLKKPVL